MECRSTQALRDERRKEIYEQAKAGLIKMKGQLSEFMLKELRRVVTEYERDHGIPKAIVLKKSVSI